MKQALQPQPSCGQDSQRTQKLPSRAAHVAFVSPDHSYVAHDAGRAIEHVGPLGKSSFVTMASPARSFHAPSVGQQAVSTTGNDAENPLSNASKSAEIRCHDLTPERLQALFASALREANLADHEAAKAMDIGPSQFSRQLQGHEKNYLQFQKWAALPYEFWISFAVALAESLGCVVRRPTLADQTVRYVMALMQQFAVLLEQQNAQERHAELQQRRTA